MYTSFFFQIPTARRENLRSSQIQNAYMLLGNVMITRSIWDDEIQFSSMALRVRYNLISFLKF